MRLAVQADQGYTPLKLNDQNVEDDVTITQDLNTWKIKTLHGKFPNSTRKSQVDRVLYIVAFHMLSILRWKVLQMPSKAG